MFVADKHCVHAVRVHTAEQTTLLPSSGELGKGSVEAAKPWEQKEEQESSDLDHVIGELHTSGTERRRTPTHTYTQSHTQSSTQTRTAHPYTCNGFKCRYVNTTICTNAHRNNISNTHTHSLSLPLSLSSGMLLQKMLVICLELQPAIANIGVQTFIKIWRQNITSHGSHKTHTHTLQIAHVKCW